VAGSILIVDDEVQLVASIERLLRAEGYQTLGVHDGVSARHAIRDFFPDVALVDLRLPDTDGITLMTDLRDLHPGARYIIITAHESIRTAVDAMRRGASNYITKPFNPDELILSVHNAMERRLKDEELSLLRNAARPSCTRKSGPTNTVDEPDFPSKAMRSALAQARTVARTESVVLILGESGSGKDFIARYIHDHSMRSNGPFFTINCAAIAAELAESELFGHEPGAFTGAQGRKRGLLELAQDGTLVLNEIGELSPKLQAKLLTFLDTRSFTRVGGERQVSVNARILAATNRPLEEDVKTGRFRKDLYYRLHVFALTVPPLRQRAEDIPVLSEQILGQLSSEIGLHTIPEIDPAAMKALMSYSWSGNVRELRNVLERTLILSGTGPLRLSSLALGENSEDWFFPVKFPTDRSIHEVADDVKRSLIKEALHRSEGSKKEAARLLRISRFALAHQIKALATEE
jgi:DNA-binding NtrC family response regulator